MDSLQTRLLKSLMHLLGEKRKWKPPRKKRWLDIHYPYWILRKGCAVEQFKVQQTSISILTPKKIKTKKVLIYIHGGAFMYGPVGFHWQAIADIANKAGCVTWMVDYPKTPEHQALEVTENILATYQEALKRYDADRILLGGDSAGGNLLLSLALQLPALKLPFPSRLIPICPLMDMSLENPAILEVQPREVLLNVKHLQVIHQWYLGQTNSKDPLVSPLFGNLSNLPPINIFIATDDILMPDQRLFVENVSRTNTTITVHEGKDMIHAWPIFPTPEGKKARQIIINLILQAKV